MEIRNIVIFVKPDETLEDLICEVCDEAEITDSEPFVFGAVISGTDDKRRLKINSLVDGVNVYSIREALTIMYESDKDFDKDILYVQAPLELWLETFKPLMCTMINNLHDRYRKLIPEYDDMQSILYMCIFNLYRKGYYLHRYLIQKAYINDLNLECRKFKQFQNIEHLDSVVYNDGDRDITLSELIPCDTSAISEYEAWYNKFLEVKAVMLEDMSELAFYRILLQLKTNTIDRNTSYILAKYRDIFNSGYTPRPNKKGGVLSAK